MLQNILVELQLLSRNHPCSAQMGSQMSTDQVNRLHCHPANMFAATIGSFQVAGQTSCRNSLLQNILVELWLLGRNHPCSAWMGSQMSADQVNRLYCHPANMFTATIVSFQVPTLACLQCIPFLAPLMTQPWCAPTPLQASLLESVKICSLSPSICGIVDCLCLP